MSRRNESNESWILYAIEFLFDPQFWPVLVVLLLVGVALLLAHWLFVRNAHRWTAAFCWVFRLKAKQTRIYRGRG